MDPSRESRKARLAELAERIGARARSNIRHCPSGWPRLDHALGGGFAFPGLHELVAAVPGAPVRTIALQIAAHAAAGAHDFVATASTAGSDVPGRWILYIEDHSAPDLYPPAAVDCGVSLGRLILIRTRGVFDALWVCEQALRCSAVAAVVLSLRHLESYVSRRLQLAAEEGGGLGLVLRSDSRAGHTFASSRILIEPLPPWQDVRQADSNAGGRPQPSRDRKGASLSAAERSILSNLSPSAPFDSAHFVAADTDARRVRISVLKLREGRPPPPFEMDLSNAPGALPVHALPADRPREARQRAG